MDCTTLRPAVAAGVIFAVIVLTSIAFQADATTYIGIYADEVHSECSSYPAPFMLVSFWVWVQPGADGMICVDYEITTPSMLPDMQDRMGLDASTAVPRDRR